MIFPFDGNGRSRGGVVSGTFQLNGGDKIQVLNYTFDGSEAYGMYAFLVNVFDSSDSRGWQLIAQMASSFVFHEFTTRDIEGYVRLDSAAITNSVNGRRFLQIKGRLVPITLGYKIYIVVGRYYWYEVESSSFEDGYVDVTSKYVPPGIHDVTLVIVPTNGGGVNYDSHTAPSILKVPLPAQTGGGGKG